MSLLQDILFETLRMLVLAAPFLLLGLVLAGFLHVLMPARLIQRWLGEEGLSGVTKAALVGVPLPVCSCGVVPIAVEMRRKGASRPSSLSFLTTTPESSIDSIFFTWGLMGPLMAVARPIAAFLTAVIGGVLAIAYPPLPGEKEGEHHDHEHSHDHDHGEAHEQGDDCEDHDHSHSLGGEQAEEALAALEAACSPRNWRLPWRKKAQATDETETPGLWRTLVRPALRYGLAELLDDLAFWLVAGIVIAGVMGALIPADLGDRGLGSGLLPMLLLLVAGIPLYMCASASTPVAAALMAKGISPGAALVFLLAGPATNAATILLLGKTFGRRFIKIYLFSVAVGAVASGVALDVFIGFVGWQVAPPIATGEESGFGLIAWASTVVIVVLLVASFWRGSARQGWRELTSSFSGLAVAPAARRRWRRGLASGLAALALVAYLGSGFRLVPTDSHGYGFRFGELVAENLDPGLHYFWPAPIGRFETRRTEYARKTDVGFKTDLELLERRRELMLVADPDEWHSPVAAMNADVATTSYLTADENLVELSFTVHYELRDSIAFFYRLDHRRDLVALYAEAAAREYLASMYLDDVLTVERAGTEAAIRGQLQAALDGLETGIRVVSVHVVDVHPPAGAVFAFRDVSSAREERETRIHRARELEALELPRARGAAAKILAESRATAEAQKVEAVGEAGGFVAQAGAYAGNRELLRHVLWIETAERVLGGREKFIVPPGTTQRRVGLWRDQPSDSER